MRSGQRLRAALVTVLVLTLAGCGGGGDAQSAAVDAPSTPAPSIPVPAAPTASAAATAVTLPVGTRVHNQRLLDEVAAQIPQGRRGFARIVTDLGTLGLTLYWKGVPPASVRALAGTTDSGVEVEIVEAAVSKAELDAAIKRIIAAARAGRVAEPDSIVVNDNFDGLTLGFVKARFGANSTGPRRAAYRKLAKLPVRFVVAAAQALD